MAGARPLLLGGLVLVAILWYLFSPSQKIDYVMFRGVNISNKSTPVEAKVELVGTVSETPKHKAPLQDPISSWGESDAMFSSVKCQSPCCDLGERNRTCWFKNLFIRGKQFFYFGKPDSVLPTKADLDLYLSSRTWGLTLGLGGVKIKEVKNVYTPEELEDIKAAQLVPGLNVLLNNIDANIGHSVFDNLICAWSTLLRWNVPNANFSFVLSRGTRSSITWPGCWGGPQWLEQFSGRQMQYADLCNAGSLGEVSYDPQKLFRFEDMVMGGGASGLVSVDQNYAAFANPRELEILRHYRDRVYERFGIPPGQADRNASKLNITWALSKREVRADWNLFKKQLEEALPVQLNVIRWEDYRCAQQAVLVSQTNIFVSGVGTSQLNQVSLRDGSVFINLGSFDVESPSGFLQSHNYRDVHIQPGMTYVWPIFYRVDKPLTSADYAGNAHVLQYQEVEDTLREAVKIFRKGFDIPIPVEVSYPPHEKACRDVFQRDKTVWLRFVLQLPPGKPYTKPYIVPEPYETAGMDITCMGYCKTLLEVKAGWNTSACPVDKCLIMRARNEFMNEKLSWPGC